MQLGLGHGALEAQQQAVGVLAGVVDAVLVDDQGLGQGTELEQAIPVAAGAGQPRGLQAEDGAGVAEADLGDEGLEAVAAGGGGARSALILVDDRDRLGGQPRSRARRTRSYCRAVLAVCSRTCTSVDWRT